MGKQSAGRLIQGIAVLQLLLCMSACSTSTEANADVQGDPQLAARVKDTLRKDERIDTARINVTAEHGGVVHLSGIVASDEVLKQVKRDTQTVPGVRAVVEDLQLQQLGGAG